MDNTDYGRDPTGQALAVPATPASAVDGPSGFDPSRIPHGPYCYASLGTMDEHGLMNIGGMCPYWEHRDGDHAYCKFLNYETEVGRELLWDHVKVCGVNDGDPHPSTIVGGAAK